MQYIIIKKTNSEFEIIKPEQATDATNLWDMQSYAAQLVKNFPAAEEWKSIAPDGIEIFQWKNKKGDTVTVAGD